MWYTSCMANFASTDQHIAVRNLLKRVGLDDREVEVYLALLALKRARATDVAKAAKQSRSHTYVVLRDLQQKGLVSEVEHGKILQFIAEPPERILSYLKDREQEIQRLQTLVQGAIPQLTQLTTPLDGQPRVTLLTGLEGMKQIYRDVLVHDFVGFFNPKAMYDAFQENVFTKIFGKNIRLRGRDLLQRNPESRRYIREIVPNDRYQVRLLPKDTMFETDTIVFGDTIALFAYDDERTIVRIENRKLADTFRAWHQALWKISKAS